MSYYDEPVPGGLISARTYIIVFAVLAILYYFFRMFSRTFG